MAKGFKTGGRQKGTPNKPKELMLTPAERGAIAGNARVHAKIIPALTFTPLDMMLANMNLAWAAVNDMEAYITSHSEAPPMARLESFKQLLALRDRAQAYARAAAPYVHPKLQAAAATPEEERSNPLFEADSLREHMAPC
jgi:hypothetical protein